MSCLNILHSYCHNFQQTYQDIRKMHNAQKKPLDSLKEQIEQLLGDLGEEASKSPNKNKKANTGVVRGQHIIPRDL